MFSKKDTKKVNEVLDLSSKVLRVLYLLLITVAIYILVMLFKEIQIFPFIKTLIKIVSPLFIGLLIAWLFDPFVNFLEKRRVKRVFGATITYVLLFLVLFVVMAALIPLLTSQATEFINTVPSIFETVKVWVSNLLNNLGNNDLIDAGKLQSQFLSYAEDFASELTTKIPQNFIGFVSRLFSWLGSLLLGLIIGFFLIVNFDSSSNLFKFIPKRFRKTTLELLDEVNVSLRGYVRGAILDCLLIFVLSSIGLWLCGLKVPALFGLFCGLTNVIPYAGPYIGGVPAVVVGFTQSSSVGIFSLIVIAVIQFLEGNFLQPIIMAKTTKLHPVTIMLGLLVFGYFFGIVGMLISTPVIASIKTVFKFFDNKYEIIENEVEEG